jgi:hypothetical protein
MKNKSTAICGAGAAGVVFLALNVAAQQTPQAAAQNSQASQNTVNGAGAYDAGRERAVAGTVVSYAPNSTTAPQGARLTLQTSSSLVDVHLGNARLLLTNHFSLQAGDAVSVTGENVAFGNGTIFVARSIQKGNQVLVLRSKNGVPLLPTAVVANGKISAPAGAR